MTKYGMLFDSTKCIGCQSCSIACREANGVPDGVSRLQVRIVPGGTYPVPRLDFQRQSCVMCDNPPCVPVCPTGASYINADGITLVDSAKCIGCKYCVVACPYQARFINPVTHVADKCTFCVDRLAAGQQPACVAQCPTGALQFGDLEASDSNVSKARAAKVFVAPKEHLGTKPKLVVVPSKGGVK